MGRTTEDLIKEAMDKANEGVARAVEHASQFMPTTAPGASQTGQPEPPTNGETPPPTEQDKETSQPAAQASNQTPANQPDKPENDPMAQIAQLQKNYDHLRSYADRTSGRNAELERENVDLKRQLQILLSSMSTTPTPPAQEPGVQAGSDSNVAQPPQAEVPDQITPPPVNKRQELRAKLGELTENFPEVMGPLIEYLDAIETEVQSELGKVKPVVETIVEDTRNRALSEFEQARNKAYSEIEQGLPGWKSLVFTDSSNPDESPINPALMTWLQKHPDGYLYSKMLFPDINKGEGGGTPSTVVKILKEFQASLGAIANERERAAAQDAQTMITPKSFVPNANVAGDPVERLKAGGQITQQEVQQITAMCRGNALLWHELWPLVNKAFDERRVVYTGAYPGSLYT